MDDIDLAQALGGRLRKEGAQSAFGQTRTVVAVASSDSKDGMVDVVLPGESVTSDGRIQVPAATTVDVRAGDSVQVNVSNRSPVVVGVIGGGDRTRADIDLAKQAAEEAQRVTEDASEAAKKAQDAADEAKKTAQDLTESTNKSLDEVTQIANGAAGLANSAVKSVDVEYALGDSQTKAPTSGWSTTAPAWQAGRYMWQRTKVTPVSGEPTYSDPTCIQGAAGKDGHDGRDGADGTPGPAGKDGESNFFHVAYATSADGSEGFSTTDASGKTYLGTYVDGTVADSQDFRDYSWSLIRGADGTDGIPGTDGKDGVTYYLHIAYADSADGREGFSTSSGAEKSYIGQCVDTGSADPEDPSLYTWSLIKGRDGKDGTGVTIKGSLESTSQLPSSGSDGDAYLIAGDLWVWTGEAWENVGRIQGPAGADGTDGKDAVQRYLHIAYADSADGTKDFSTSDASGRSYMGQCVDTSQADPETPASYTWSLIKGSDGRDGTPGPAGADGESSYFHVKYAPVINPTASQMTETPDRYIGTYVDGTRADSNDPSDYAWVQLEGRDGANGADGVAGRDGRDGTTSYLHLAYANSADGRTDFSTTDPDRQYLGQCVNTSQPDPTTPSSYSWSLIRGRDGKDGSGITIKGTLASTSMLPAVGLVGDMWIVNGDGYVWGGSGWSNVGRIQGPAGSDGADGADGRPGTDAVQYYLHRAYATSSDGRQGFSTTVADGKTYMGTCVDTNRADPTTPSSYTWARFRGADGADGADGEDGRGISAIREQYYLSTSSTYQTGGSWSSSQPAWQKGRWIWTRSMVTWDDGTISYTTPVLAVALNGANEAAQAVASHVWENTAGLHVSTNEKPASGDDTGRNVLLNALGILLRNATTVLGSFTGSGIVLYDGDGTPRLSITSSGVQMLDADGRTEVAHFAANTQLGKAAGKHIVLDASSGIVLMDGSAILGSFNPSAMTVGNTSGLHLATTANGIGIYQGGTLLALFGPTSVQLGANSSSSVVSMCGGKGTIEYRKDYFATGSDAFVVSADALVNLLSTSSTVRMLASPSDLKSHGAVQAARQHVSIGVGDGSDTQFGSGGYIDLTATQLMLRSDNIGFSTAGYYSAMRDWVKQTGLSNGLMVRKWASGRASYRGTVVITPNGQSHVVWTGSQFASLFGGYTAGQTHVSFFNGDSGANTVPVCAGYYPPNGSIMALFPQVVSGSYRIDYMVEN